MADTIKTWSYSRLKIYEQCPYRAKLAYIDKRPEPADIPKAAAERGTAIHNDFEMYIKGEIDHPPAMVAKYLDVADPLRDGYKLGKVQVEGEWGFTHEWAPTEWSGPDTWCRMKLDVLEFTSEISATAWDWKSGKKIGNEVAHAQQAQAYVIGTMMKFPELEHVTTTFFYVDQNGQPTKRDYSREKMLALLPSWNNRALAMTNATEFPAKPNKVNCRFCPYGPNNKGDRSCPWGVEL